MNAKATLFFPFLLLNNQEGKNLKHHLDAILLSVAHIDLFLNKTRHVSSLCAWIHLHVLHCVYVKTFQAHGIAGKLSC